MRSFADVTRLSQKPFVLLFNCLTILVASLFIALCSQVAFSIGISPVPLTLQTFAILVIAALLGSKKGALAIFFYLIEGAFGLPVFAGGAAGISMIAGPRGGYLVAFVISAYVVGYLLEKGWHKKHSLTVLAMIIGSLIILVIGASWLSLFVGVQNAITMGIYPYLIGDILKVSAATLTIFSSRKVLHFLR